MLWIAMLDRLDGFVVCAHTHGGRGLLCACVALMAWVWLCVCCYTRETQTGGRIYPSIGDWIMVSLLLPCFFVYVCLCAWLLVHLLLLPCVLFCPVRSSTHQLLSTAYETHIEWGGRSHHHIHIYEFAKLNLWMLLFTAAARTSSKRAVLTRCYTQQQPVGLR